MRTGNAQIRNGRDSVRLGDRYAISFRRKFQFVTMSLLAASLMIGLFARYQQHAIIDYAVTIYDTAFISTNYVSLAQISFQHYLDDRFRAAGSNQTSETSELLESVLDNMDVATERSSSPSRAPRARKSEPISPISSILERTLLIWRTG